VKKEGKNLPRDGSMIPVMISWLCSCEVEARVLGDELNNNGNMWCNDLGGDVE
jgi:hypothetical protein